MLKMRIFSCIILIGIVTYIHLDQPVAALQFDVTTNAPSPTLSSSVVGKEIVCAEISGGWRCVVYGMNQTVMSGHVVTIQGNVDVITNVVGANPDSTARIASLQALSNPQNVTITKVMQ